MADLLGPDPAKHAASLVHRVLCLAQEKGHDDPRHSDHYWEWKDWPLDGRQYTYNVDLGTYELHKKHVAEHQRRAVQEGFENTGLLIERKLEGAIWRQKKYPKGRTVIRAKKSFPKTWFPKAWFPKVEDFDDDDKNAAGVDSDDEEDIRFNLDCAMPLWKDACCLRSRRVYDASITQRGKISAFNLYGHFQECFAGELDIISRGEFGGRIMNNGSFFTCSGAFAVPGEQDKECGVPCCCLGAIVLHRETRSQFAVVVDAPIPPTADVPETKSLVEMLDDRIAGFVLEQHSDNTVSITYVESAMDDLQMLDEDQKDAFLIDRALVVNRFVASVVTEERRGELLQHVPTLRHGRPDVSAKPPPGRTVDLMMPVHRADPRFPLMKPNSICLECGKAPQKVDPESDVDSLHTCSKCCMRKFCSKACHTKSWKSEVWSHKAECSLAMKQDVYGTTFSLREAHQEATATHGCCLSEPEFEEMMKQRGVDIDEKVASGSVEELRSQRQAKQKVARRAAKKKRGKKK